MIQIQLKPDLESLEKGPIEHLLACHRRIEQRLDILDRAGKALEAQSSEEALTAIANTLRFMDISGALHTRDEEESVFPRIRQLASTEEIAYLSDLENEHGEVDALYVRLKDVSASLLQSITPELVRDYREVVSKIGSAYRRHIASEDSVMVELARRVLNSTELESIQAEMRARRR
jgi:hemerythrin-like domain-containing protein